PGKPVQLVRACRARSSERRQRERRRLARGRGPRRDRHVAPAHAQGRRPETALGSAAGRRRRHSAGRRDQAAGMGLSQTAPAGRLRQPADDVAAGLRTQRVAGAAGAAGAAVAPAVREPANDRQWLRGQPQGSELDMQAWLDFHVERQHGHCAERGLFMEQRQNRRDLACLLLADLSMSTDAHLNDEHRVIDVIADSLMLFGEALSAVGDDFALYGFSSLRRQQVRMQELKSFRQRYGDETRGRIQALRPGFYTRMGAAIRQATDLLGARKQRRKLLLLVTDGKPNDLDLYEGRYGVEDTRMAVLEARRQGLLPFCITIDSEAGDYLPYMFGAN